MKLKGTWIFLGVVVLLIGFTVWDVQQDKKQQDKKQQDSYLVPHQGDHVQKISIERPDETVEMEKSVDGWKLTKPLQDWADNGAVQDFIFMLTSAKSEKVLSQDSAVDPTLYGLAPPAGTIRITLQNGEQVAWEVGQNKSHEGDTYLRKPGQKEVILAKSDWSDWIVKKPFDFRDRRLFRGRISGVMKIDIKTTGENIHLEKKDNKWQTPGLSIDQNRVQEFLNELNQADATEIISEKEVPAATKEKYIGKVPKYEVALNSGEKNWKAQINDIQTNVYALVSDPVFLFKMEPAFIKKIKYLKPSTFRDKKEPFDFNKDAVKKIEFQTKLKTQTFEAQDNSMAGLMDKLKMLKILDFAKSSAGLNNKIILKDQADKIIFELAWGEPQKLKFDDSDKNVVLAKSSLSKDSFFLEQSEIEKLNLQQIIKEKAEKKE
jgi:hypothetical protein